MIEVIEPIKTKAMEKKFDTLEAAWKFIWSVPETCKLRWVARIAKWVVTVVGAYLVYAAVC